MRQRAIQLSDRIAESTGAGGEHAAEVVPFGTIGHPLNLSLEGSKLIVLEVLVRGVAAVVLTFSAAGGAGVVQATYIEAIITKPQRKQTEGARIV